MYFSVLFYKMAEEPNLMELVSALIFASENPISLIDLKLCIEPYLNVEIEDSVIENAISEIRANGTVTHFGFEVVLAGGGYQFLTKAQNQPLLLHLVQLNAKKKLSQSALETLAIIAYKQPVTKPELEQIRGVNCDYAIQKLLERDLICIKGKSDSPGKPTLYGTTSFFMDYFGINSIQELPQLKDIKIEHNELGNTE